MNLNFTVLAINCSLQVAEFSLPSVLRHHPLSSSSSLRLLYTGIWSAVSPVCLECLLAQAVVRNGENFVVFFFRCICSLFDAFCCKNETIWPREERMKSTFSRICLSSLISRIKNVG